MHAAQNKTAGSAPPFCRFVFARRYQRRSCSTLACDWLASASAETAIDWRVDSAATTLRSEASALGSNLSIVQIRQDFNKNLINVLQTGSSNLTLADSNEEAANSQALSTRQSIATSALALANQSQQAVLQLLR